MHTRGFTAAFSAAFFMLGAIAVFVAGGMRPAAAVECKGPFAQCVIEVGGFCEIADGKQRMIYYDRTGSVMRFEECIGRVFEAHGKRNPYKPAAAEKQTPKRQ